MDQGQAIFLVARDVMWGAIFVAVPLAWSANVCDEKKTSAAFNLWLYNLAVAALAFYLGTKA